MTRTRYARSRTVEDEGRIDLCLLIGATDFDGYTDQELEGAWRERGEKLMVGCTRYGHRPWGWWVFEQGEDPPQGRGAQEVRLAELGELTDEEVAGLAERANVAKARVGTPAEHCGPNYFPDRDAIELYERVRKVRRR